MEGQEAQSDAGSTPDEPPQGDADVPDVTVVIAVYNTMPYLVECLDSMLAQTLHVRRPGSVEVIVVDDGSTDGSGEVLDRYAAEHPDLFTLVRQENSGGPARPNNVALDRARGRWVYFVGADDHLAPEALERMTAYGDAVGAGVVIGRQVGVGRYVPNALFGKDHPEIDPFGPHLRWTLANSKLFRRSLVEDLGLRYREDMRIGSDQPFTLRACLAGTVAVLGSYDCYYVVRRADESNVTFGVDLVRRAHDTERLIDAVAEMLPEEHRAHVLVRHFTWELNRLLPSDVHDLPADVRDEVLAVVRRVAQRWHSPELDLKLGVAARVRLRLAAAGETEALGLLRDAVDGDEGPSLLLTGGRALAAYPVLRTPAAARAGLSDDDFVISPRSLERRVRHEARVEAVQAARDRLGAVLHLPLDPASSEAPMVWVGPEPKPGEGVPGTLVRDGSAYRLEVVAPAGTPSLTGRLGSGDWRVYVGGRVTGRGGQQRPWAVALTGFEGRGVARGILGRLKRRMAGVRDEG